MDRELNLQDLQRQSLKIMKEIDKWCLENKVNYTLCGGSLIGAIRHKGFIPWDDDVDIAMPRPDYEKFVHGFANKGLICIAPELENSWIPFARVCDTQFTYAKPYAPWCVVSDFGVGVDVFPWDGEPDNESEFKQHMARVIKRLNLLYQVRGAHLPFSWKLGAMRIIKNIAKKVLYGRYDIDGILKDLLHDIQKYPFGSTRYCGNFSCPTYKEKERSRTEVFTKYMRVPFEECEFSIICDYDEYLRDIFGDYMILPPEKDRVPKHSEHRFYFK